MAKVDWKNEINKVESLINDGVAYSKIGKLYGVTGASVKKAAKKFGIKLVNRREINPSEHFNRGKSGKHICLNCGQEFSHRYTGENKFCSIKCQRDYEFNEYIERWKSGEEDGLNGEYGISKRIKRYFMEKYKCKCQKCGWGEKNEYTNTIPLEIHHIDGDYKNNSESNLQLLCPNCHSLTETVKSHNKNGRKGRKKYDK